MGLYKREKTWWVSFTYKGKQYQKSTETSDKKQAENVYCKIKTQLIEEKWFEKLPGEEKTVRELMEKYLKEHSKSNKSPTSFLRDRQVSDHWIQFLGNMQLSEVTSNLISQFKQKRRENGAAPATINKELSVFSHAFNLSIKEWGWVRDNPVRNVSREKDHRGIERWLTVEEEEKLLNQSPLWLKEIIVFAIHTGLREGEILSLKWSQIDFSRKALVISEQKNKGVDTLPLNETVLSVLREKTKIRNIYSNLVFLSNNGTKMDGGNLRRAFYASCKRAGIENLRFHDLRHTFASRLVQAGVDLYAVQKLGRWKTLSMVLRYAHHHPESLRSSVEILDKIRPNFMTNLLQSTTGHFNNHG